MTKNILVTGGAGYAGSVLTGLLLNNGHKVIVVDNLSFSGQALLNFWRHPSFKFVKGDITVGGVLKGIFDDYRIDAVIHLAAIVGDPACSKQPDLARKVNWEASSNLLELSLKNRVRNFIFTSTCSNYGRMADSDGYLNEDSELAPISLYAESKVKFEKAILSLKKTESFCPTLLRLATLYGVSPRMRFDLTVNEFTKELSLGRELEVFGEQFWRPYCHVYDFARAVLLVLNSEKSKIAYNVFNVGDTGENYQKQMIVNEIKKHIPDIKVKYVHKDEDPRNYRVTFDKIRYLLEFKVSKNVSEGVKEVRNLINQGVILDPDNGQYKNS